MNKELAIWRSKALLAGVEKYYCINYSEPSSSIPVMEHEEILDFPVPPVKFINGFELIGGTWEIPQLRLDDLETIDPRFLLKNKSIKYIERLIFNDTTTSPELVNLKWLDIRELVVTARVKKLQPHIFQIKTLENVTLMDKYTKFSILTFYGTPYISNLFKELDIRYTKEFDLVNKYGTYLSGKKPLSLYLLENFSKEKP